MGKSLYGIETRSVSPPTGGSDGGQRYLLIVTGDRSRRHFLPNRGTQLIGRSDDTDVTVADVSVSRRHARLAVAIDDVSIGDCGSHNGTSVNGVLIEDERQLVSGDVIGLGEVTLIFHDERRKTRPRRFLRSANLLERLEEETDRALRHGRPLATIACAFPAGERSHAALAAALAEVIGPSDVTGWTEDELLLILLPEVDGQRATAVAEVIHGALSQVLAPVRVGLALAPGDGSDAATLISAARAAATDSSQPGVVAARTTTRRLEVGDDSIIVADPSMDRVYQLLRRVAPTELPVLVSGETGVGKEHAAHAVHAWSKRAEGPFIAVNCAALPLTLIESELFGHRRGAFSGASDDKAGLLEAAAKGTIFFDEIGELPAAAQAKLLRALDSKRIIRLGDTDERELDIRIVAATNRDLDIEVAEGRFRSDLLFRLNAAAVVILPLRERRREIPVLARAFLAATGKSLEIGDGAMRVLAEYRWPGNVRELKNAIEFAAVVAEGAVEPWHLPARIYAEESRASAAGSTAAESAAEAPVKFRPVAEEVEELEQRRMLEALEQCGGVQTRAADLIGMPRRTFTTKLRKYGIKPTGA